MINEFITSHNFIKLMQDAVKSKKIEIIPKRFDKIYFHWINNLRDWCISRQIWYGHRIPVWYCKDCGETRIKPSDNHMGDCPECGSENIEDMTQNFFNDED